MTRTRTILPLIAIAAFCGWGDAARARAVTVSIEHETSSRVVLAVPARGPPVFLFPNNVDCRDFDKTGYKVWNLRHRSEIDLGNWDGAFNIDGPISPRAFVRNGIDLYDVLEGKCDVQAVRYIAMSTNSLQRT